MPFLSSKWDLNTYQTSAPEQYSTPGQHRAHPTIINFTRQQFNFIRLQKVLASYKRCLPATKCAAQLQKVPVAEWPTEQPAKEKLSILLLQAWDIRGDDLTRHFGPDSFQNSSVLTGCQTNSMLLDDWDLMGHPGGRSRWHMDEWPIDKELHLGHPGGRPLCREFNVSKRCWEQKRNSFTLDTHYSTGKTHMSN